MGAFKVVSDRQAGAGRRGRWLKLGTCLSGTAAALLVGTTASHASPYRFTAPPILSRLARAQGAEAAPQDLTVSKSVPTARMAALSGVVVSDGDVSTSGDNMPAISTHSTSTTDISAGAITTSGAQSSGIVADGTGSITIGVDSVQTAGDFAYGVRAVAGDMPVFDPVTNTVTLSPPADLTITAGSIATGGFGADGVYAANLTTGATNVSVGTVSTQGAQAWGVNANGAGDVNVDVGYATTYGFNGVGVGAGSHGGNVNVSATSVYTVGDSSVGILAQATGGYDADHNRINGNVTVTAEQVGTASDYSTGIRTVADGNTIINADFVTTHGNSADGISASGGGSIAITAGNIFTSGDASNAITAVGDGDISINGTALATQGANSWGVYANSFAGGVDINVGTISTQGENGVGVVALAAGDLNLTADKIQSSGLGVYALTTGGDIAITTGTVTTHGAYAAGIVTYNLSAAGKTDVNAGAVSTSRDGSIGIVAEGFGDVSVHAGNVTTSGYGSLGILGYSVDGAVSITADKVKTAGEYATGITLTNLGINQPSTVSAGDIEVSGDHSQGVQVIALAGGADVDVGTVTTGGLFGTGINVNTNLYGYQPVAGVVQTTIKADTIKTTGAGSAGIAVKALGNVDIEVGSVETAGDMGAQGHTVIFSKGITTEVLDGDTHIKAGEIATSGRGAVGIQTYAFNGNTTIEAGTIATSGIYAPGVLARSHYGDINISADAVTTAGLGSTGIVARAYGSYYTPGSNVTISAGSVATSGDHAAGIIAVSPYGDVNISADQIATSGAGSAGILAASFYGHTGITVGDVSTSGGADAIYAIGNGVSIKGTGTISTVGDYARGVAAFSYGNLAVDVANISTNGIGSMGIDAESAGGDINISAGTVATSGNGATGVAAIVRNLGYQPAQGDISLTLGSVSSTGDHADAVFAYTQKGNISIHADNVSATGFLSDGIGAFTYGGDIAVDVGTVNVNVGDGIEARAGYGSHGSAVITAGTIVSNGAGITALAGDDITIHAGSITTHSGTEDAGTQLGQAIKAVAHGAIDITAGDLTTTGYWAEGVYAVGNASADEQQPGDMSINVGSVTTSGTKSTGIYAINTGYQSGGKQTVTVKAGQVSTAGYAASGIYAVGANVAVTTSGSVTTKGDFSTGIYGAAVGGKTVITAGGAVSTEGAYSSAIRGFSTDGGVNITASGPISTKGNNSYGALAFGFGDLAISSSGAVTTEGTFSHGLYAVASGGDAVISSKGTVSTTGFGANGIRAVSVAGDVSILSSGLVSTSGDYANGVVAGRDRRGRGDRMEESAAAGSSVSLVADHIMTSGAHSNGAVAVNYVVGGKTTVQVVDIVTKGEGSAGIATATFGDLSLQAGNIHSAGRGIYSMVNGGSADITVSGELVAQQNGIQLISNFGNGTITIGQGAKVIGGGTRDNYGTAGNGVLVSLYQSDVEINNAGLIATQGDGFAIEVGAVPDYYGQVGKVSIRNSGTLQGAVQLSGGDDVLTNSGTFVATKDSDFGAGNDEFVNTGKFVVAAGSVPAARAAASGSHVTLLGLESFQNSGIVDLRNGVAGDTLTLPGNYVASGKAALGLDIGANGVADKFVINGTVSGTTSILINATAGNATLLSTPITLVQAGGASPAATGGGAMAANAFTIANQSVGFVAYGLSYNAASNSFQLTSQAGSPVYRLAKASEGAQSMWREAAGAWESHMAELRDMGDPSSRVWGQTFGKVETRHEDRSVAVTGGAAQSYDLGYRQDYYGAQAGVDLAGKRSDAGNGLLFGVTGGYLSSHLNFRAGADRLRFDTVDVGGYASLRTGPLFANLLGQYAHYHANAFNGVEHWSDGFSGNGYGVEGEIGARLGTTKLFAEPVASLAWQKADLGTLHALGQSLDFDHGTALTGKLGARLGGGVAMAGGGTALFYLKGSYVHEFKGKGGVLFTSGGTSEAISGTRLGDYGQAALGVDFLTTGRVSGFLEANADVGGSTHGGGGRVGLRFKL